MAKFHIGRKGKAAICSAKKGKCPFGGESEHYSSREAATKAAEDRFAKENSKNVFQGTSKSAIKKDVDKKVEFSEINLSDYWTENDKDIEKLATKLSEDILTNLQATSGFVSDNPYNDSSIPIKEYNKTIDHLQGMLGGGSEFYQKQSNARKEAIAKLGFSGKWDENELRSFYQRESNIGFDQPKPHTVFYNGDIPGMPYRLTKNSMSFKGRKDGLEEISINSGKITSRTYKKGNETKKETYYNNGETLIEKTIQNKNSILKESYTLSSDGKTKLNYISKSSKDGKNFMLEKADIESGAYKVKVSNDYSKDDLILYSDSTTLYKSPDKKISKIKNGNYEVSYIDKDGNVIKEEYAATEYETHNFSERIERTGYFIKGRTINGEKDQSLQEKIEKREQENQKEFDKFKEIYDNKTTSQILRYKGKYIRGDFKYITNDYGKQQRVLDSNGRYYYLSTAKNPETAKANNAKKGIELIDVPNVEVTILEDRIESDSIGIKKNYSYTCTQEAIQRAAFENGLITEEENNVNKVISEKKDNKYKANDVTDKFKDKK